MILMFSLVHACLFLFIWKCDGKCGDAVEGYLIRVKKKKKKKKSWKGEDNILNLCVKT